MSIRKICLPDLLGLSPRSLRKSGACFLGRELHYVKELEDIKIEG